MKTLFITLLLYCLSATNAIASEAVVSHLDMTSSTLGVVALIVFIIGYALVIAEEFIHLRKSKPVLLAAGLIWILVAILAKSKEHGKALVEHALNHNLLEYSALLLLLLTAMIYVNAMTERNVFEALRAWLIKRGYSYKKLFWITGFLAFFISPVADNLTTALLMGAVVLAVGADKPKFVSLAFINIVVAANAGGAFSPFGDITTLMVWQSGHVDFFGFFALFIPALINFLIPAAIMSFAIPNETPKDSDEKVRRKKGAIAIC